ncbi:hypothetical protein QR680_009766 [Steinernema hermaphroditum]|uniref:Metalloendopeptidase n=1 Tax=Steinernema hermaphroditum TaxID=289476 RepID=A0AA39MAK0_9BILA|nr:hypothetical protein QR680_009766 [Steinernema hermaphroditum]
MRHSAVLLLFLLLLSSWNYVDAKRGKRIDLYQQRGGDIVQIRPDGGRQVMYNSLPRGSVFRWTKYRSQDGYYVIPYVISGQFDREERMIILNAMRRIEMNSCIRFQKRRSESDYVDIQNQYYQGCYTSVGRLPGRNVVMLEANSQATCVEHDIVIHELFHTIGLWHEHMRYDRDNYIKVHFENIEQMYFSQFAKVPKGESDTFGVKYDYRSVMHYAKDAFAKRKGLISMETFDPSFQDVIGRVNDASPSDYRKICILYECKVCRGDKAGGSLPNVPAKPVPKSAPLPKVPPQKSVDECPDKFPAFCETMIGQRSRDFVCGMFSGMMKSWCCASCSSAPSFEPIFVAA